MDTLQKPEPLDIREDRRIVRPIEEVMGIRYTEVMRKAFPEADPGIYPFGYMVVVQLRTPKMKSDGGILFADETKDTDRYRTQTGLVRAVGPFAFKRRDTGEDWPGGDWCQLDGFVRSTM